MQINDNIHLFLGRNNPLESNCYLILGKKIILVDTGIESVLLIKNIKNVGIKLSDIDIIVNTHCHFDHVRSNKILKEKTGAKLAAHIKEAEHINSSSEFTRAVFHGENLQPAAVDLRLKEGRKLSDFKIIHTPGHTAGSICLFDKKSKTLISGDSIFANGNYGRTDLPSGSQSEICNSLKKLAKLNIKNILPGHGHPALGNAKESIYAAISAIILFCK